MQSNGFGVEVEHLDGTVTLRPSGELDLATAPLLERALDGVLQGGHAVVLDLSGLTFADCAGLEPIRWARQRRTSDRIRVVGARPPVERVLTLTGLQEPLNVES